MFALTLPALAEQHVERDGRGWVEENSGPLTSDKALAITRFVGSVRVVTGAKTGSYILRVHSLESQEANARKQFANYKLVLVRKNGETVIQTLGPLDLGLRSELTLQVPGDTDRVHVDTLAGRITIQGRVNKLDLRTHGGDIEVDDANELKAITMGGSVIVNHRLGDSFIQTGGGDIRVDASTGDLEISSLGGNVWLKAIAQARIQSGGGNIEVVRCLGSLLVRTAGGNINLGEMGGSVTAETGGGSIRVGVAHSGVVANTALGNIELWKLAQGAQAHTGMGRITAEFIGDRKSIRESELVTSMGDVIVFFAGDAPGNIHAITGGSPSKRIVSDFSSLKISNGLAQYGPRSIAADGAIHGGGPLIEVRTTLGQIELRKAR